MAMGGGARTAPCDDGFQDAMAAPVSKFEQWRGFAVHLLTASGAFWAFLSIIAAADHRWVAMFGWLGLALLLCVQLAQFDGGRCGWEHGQHGW